MPTRARFSLALAGAFVLLLGADQAAPLAAQDASGFAGHAACKSCHLAIHEAWTGTKHARALARLSTDERTRECVGCHVTGTPELIAATGADPAFPDVQCEACHGPAKAHAADPAVTAGLVRKPGAAACERCHNSKSPHYKGFYYSALVGLVHPVKNAAE